MRNTGLGGQGGRLLNLCHQSAVETPARRLDRSKHVRQASRSKHRATDFTIGQNPGERDCASGPPGLLVEKLKAPAAGDVGAMIFPGPRRILVGENELDAARALLEEAGFAREIRRDGR